MTSAPQMLFSNSAAFRSLKLISTRLRIACESGPHVISAPDTKPSSMSRVSSRRLSIKATRFTPYKHGQCFKSSDGQPSLVTRSTIWCTRITRFLLHPGCENSLVKDRRKRIWKENASSRKCKALSIVEPSQPSIGTIMASELTQLRLKSWQRNNCWSNLKQDGRLSKKQRLSFEFSRWLADSSAWTFTIDCKKRDSRLQVGFKRHGVAHAITVTYSQLSNSIRISTLQ